MRPHRDLDRNTTAICVVDWRNRAPAERAARIAIITLLTLASLLLVVAHTIPVRSQGVQLVKVDVEVVAKGHRASKLISRTVVNDKNERIGTLDDIIIGRDRALFAILQVGGFLGLGGHLIAVPYDNLVLDEAGTKIELPGATKEELKNLTEFKYRAS